MVKIQFFTGILLWLTAVHAISASAPDSVRGEQPQKEAFHLFILAGQSNMAGRGEVQPRDRNSPDRVFKLSRTGKWVPATDPVHYDKPIAGVGPGRSFGIAVAERDTSIRVGLIPCAVGGSSITAWKPGGFHKQTQTHPYDDCLTRIRRAREDGVLKGILWHQGESDSNREEAPLYRDRLYELVARFRSDLLVPELPFIAGQLPRFEGRPRNRWRVMVNRGSASLPDTISNTAFVTTEGLTHNGDLIHFDAASARELGERYAEAYYRLQSSRE